MELERKKRALVHGAILAHLDCNARLPSFCRYDWVLGPFLAKKKAVLGHKMRSFGRAPPDLAPLLRGATGEFLAQTSDLARAPPTLRGGQGRVEPGAMRPSNGQNKKEKCLLLACGLLVACLLVACLLVS